jgi:hypothetical protein
MIALVSDTSGHRVPMCIRTGLFKDGPDVVGHMTRIVFPDLSGRVCQGISVLEHRSRRALEGGDKRQLIARAARMSIVLLVRVNELMHSMLVDIQSRSRKGNCYDPIKRNRKKRAGAATCPTVRQRRVDWSGSLLGCTDTPSASWSGARGRANPCQSLGKQRNLKNDA